MNDVRDRDSERRKWLRGAGQASTIGILLGVSTWIGYELGVLLKKYFHAPDWVVFVCVLLGIIAGFVEMIRIVTDIFKDEEEH